MPSSETCRTCCFWQNDEMAAPQPINVHRSYELWDSDNPPHANLEWGYCKAAPMGFDGDLPAEGWGAFKMAVRDGSGYAAQLSTRHDHLCAEHRPIEGGSDALS